MLSIDECVLIAESLYISRNIWDDTDAEAPNPAFLRELRALVPTLEFSLAYPGVSMVASFEVLLQAAAQAGTLHGGALR